MRTPWILAVALSLPLAAPVWAQTAQDQVIKELTQLGYRHFTVSRTWLGRVRVVAKGKPGTREIVLNPSTGVVLRDYTDRRTASDKPRRAKRPEAHGTRGDGDRAAFRSDDDKPHAGGWNGKDGEDGVPADLGYGEDSPPGSQEDWDDVDLAPPPSDTWDELTEEADADPSYGDGSDTVADRGDTIEDVSVDDGGSFAESDDADYDGGRDDSERGKYGERGIERGKDSGTGGPARGTPGN